MGEAAHGNDGNNPFASLAIWRDKVASDLEESVQSAGFRLRTLLDQSKEVEQAVWGCLKDSLSELHEGEEWGLLPREFARAQHTRLYALAAQELHTTRTLLSELAHEHGMAGAYHAGVARPLRDAIAEYERIGELRFALLVWQVDLQQALGTAGGAAEAEEVLRGACLAARDLAERCASNSAEFWGARQAHDAPTEVHRAAVVAAAQSKIRRSVLEVGRQHHVGEEALQRVLQGAGVVGLGGAAVKVVPGS